MRVGGYGHTDTVASAGARPVTPQTSRATVRGVQGCVGAAAVSPARWRPPIDEGTWQTTVIGIAKLFGWRVVHIRAVQNKRGKWMPPYEGDPGLPDLILAKGGRTVLVELKTDTAAGPTAAQRAWLDAGGGMVWRPRDKDQVERFLRDAG
jgi:hypothetical protein